MTSDDKAGGPDKASRQFAANMKRRCEAAEGMEADLLTEVPLLYGSPGYREPHGDAGIRLAKIHREELVRRNGGGIPVSKAQKPARLPLERAMMALGLILVVVFSILG